MIKIAFTKEELAAAAVVLSALQADSGHKKAILYMLGDKASLYSALEEKLTRAAFVHANEEYTTSISRVVMIMQELDSTVEESPS